MALIVNQSNLGSSKWKKYILILNREMQEAGLYANKRSTAGASFMVWWFCRLINFTASLQASVTVSCFVYFCGGLCVGKILARLRSPLECWWKPELLASGVKPLPSRMSRASVDEQTCLLVVISGLISCYLPVLSRCMGACGGGSVKISL